MDAPAAKQDWIAFYAAIDAFRAKKCMRMNGTWYCRQCKSKIKEAVCLVSIHSISYASCVARGGVEKKPLPFCPKCEGEPKDVETCVHVTI